MTVNFPPIFDPSAFLSLAERTEYEIWLLEAVYAIAEQELFPTWPDAVVYPVNKSKAQFFVYARCNIVIGDWRPGFLNAGAPLVFVSAFKLLDMLIEWALEKNELPSTFRFQEKLRQLEGSPTFPPLIESRSWLKERLTGLYRTLEPLRGTIIHDKHFTASDGAIRVSSSKNKVIGPVVEISAAHLRKFALTIVSVLRYVEGTWHLDDLRERTLRHDLDELVALHGLPPLGQQPPFHTQVRVYSTDSDPLHVDPTSIQSDLAARYVNQDCSFDLRVLMVREGAVVDAYLFPWTLFAALGPDWKHGIIAEQYTTAIPDDIKPEHLRGDAG
jgi:hypothetical protein